jgi:hypothetical protein
MMNVPPRPDLTSLLCPQAEPPSGQSGPQAVPKLKSISKLLLQMEALRTQSQKLAEVRDEFVDKSFRYISGVFRKLMRPETYPFGKRAGSGAAKLTGAQLAQYQRQFHTKLMDYDPLLEVMIQLLQAAQDIDGDLLSDMLKSYSEAGAKTLYSLLFEAYFQQVTFRPGGSRESAMSAMPRANILDTSPPSPVPDNSPDGPTASAAIQQALSHVLPIVRREQVFLTEFFRLKPNTSEEDQHHLEEVLAVEFKELRERLTEKAEAAEESDPFEGLAVLAVVKQTLETDQASEDRYLPEMLIGLYSSLATRFNRFIKAQDDWIQHSGTDIKRAGVMAPFAKFPIFVDRIHEAVRGKLVDTANASLQKLCLSLMSWLERISQRDPKYADVVRLENLHFFATTVGLRQQRMGAAGSALAPYVKDAQAQFEACTQRYLCWMIDYQFPSLTAFFQRLEDLITKVGPADVHIHVAKVNLQKEMEKNSRRTITEGLQNAYRRLRKHISDDSHLFGPLWDRLTHMLFLRFSRYEEIAQTCYDFRLEPSAVAIRQLAQECKNGGK